MPGISFPDVRRMSGGCRGICSGVRGEDWYIMAAGRGSHASVRTGRGGLSCERASASQLTRLTLHFGRWNRKSRLEALPRAWYEKYKGSSKHACTVRRLFTGHWGCMSRFCYASPRVF